MPTKIKISKDMILDAAFEIVRKDGMEKLSNRELANKLKCSIRPIYYQFENVEEMQKELYLKIEHFFYKFLLDNMIEGIPQYKQIGISGKGTGRVYGNQASEQNTSRKIYQRAQWY